MIWPDALTRDGFGGDIGRLIGQWIQRLVEDAAGALVTGQQALHGRAEPGIITVRCKPRPSLIRRLLEHCLE
jgi:hypothetical protein